ncbi:MAG: pseudouridine synthase [Planctomycetota bacterium]
MSRQRLHKILAAAGVASRRRCEELIAEGLVTVDGEPVTSQGLLVDPEVQDIRFDGARIRLEPPAYYLVNKPVGYVCTNRDEFGKRTVVSLVRDKLSRRLYTVGRLDEESEGLIIVTNDGEFANRIAHPRYGVEKTYALKVHGYLGAEELDRVRKGVWLSEGRSPSLFVKVERRGKQFTHVIVRIAEGRNRVLRRVFAKVGHAVARLKRVRIGSIGMKGLGRGGVRQLRAEEIQELLADCDARERESAARPKPARIPRAVRPAGDRRSAPAKGGGAAGEPRGGRPAGEGRGGQGGRGGRRSQDETREPARGKGGGKAPARRGPGKSGGREAPREGGRRGGGTNPGGRGRDTGRKGRSEGGRGGGGGRSRRG